MFFGNKIFGCNFFRHIQNPDYLQYLVNLRSMDGETAVPDIYFVSGS